MKKILSFFSIVMLSLMIAGCGGGDDKENTQAPSEKVDEPKAEEYQPIKKNSVRIVDGYIKNAIVKDSQGQAVTYSKNGEYAFKSNPIGTIYVYGGTFEGSGVKNKFDYKVNAKYKVISPLTHFVTNYPEQKENLLKALDVNEADLNIDFYGKLKENKNNEKYQNIAKTAQIFYALEVNELLKDLKNFTSFQDIVSKSLNLATNFQDSIDLIMESQDLTADEILNAENHLASIKTELLNSSSKASGIRLEGKWIFIGTSSECSKDVYSKSIETVTYQENFGYTFKSKTLIQLDPHSCKIKVFNENETEETINTYENIVHPLPIEEFDKAKNLSIFLSNAEYSDNLEAEGKGVKLISPDKFINKATSKGGFLGLSTAVTTSTYTRVEE